MREFAKMARAGARAIILGCDCYGKANAFRTPGLGADFCSFYLGFRIGCDRSLPYSPSKSGIEIDIVIVGDIFHRGFSSSS